MTSNIQHSRSKAPAEADTPPGHEKRLYEAIVLHPQDNVATLIVDGQQGESLLVRWPSGDLRPVRLAEDVPFGHKIATSPILADQHIQKYGESIGVARKAIAVGQHVHVHNVESRRGRGDLAAGVSHEHP